MASDEQLWDLLVRRVRGEPPELKQLEVHQDPWELFVSEESIFSPKQLFFFFCVPRNHELSLITPSGSWSIESFESIKLDDGNQGEKRRLKFHLHPREKPTSVDYRMEEYRLTKDTYSKLSVLSEEIMLCKVYQVDKPLYMTSKGTLASMMPRKI